MITDDGPVEEHSFYTDDSQIIRDLLRDEWSLEIGHEPAIFNDPEQSMYSSNYGAVYVYLINRNTQVYTVDYRTLSRTARVGIKVSSRFRNYHFEICEEIWRILLANRRAGVGNLGPYSFLEVTNERISNDLSGYYNTTIDVKLTSYSMPIRSGGFGAELNKKLEDNGSEPLP